MSNSDQEGGSTPAPKPQKKRTELRQVMVRIEPKFFAALELVTKGRDKIGSSLRKNSVSALVVELLRTHEEDVLKEAAKYVGHERWPTVPFKKALSPQGVMGTKKRQR
jgi:hypothetical protein